MSSLAMPSESGASENSHHYALRIVYVVLFWMVAAIMVGAADARLTALYPSLSVLVKTGAILLAALAYVKLTAKTATVEQALLVGVCWVLLSITGELISAAIAHHASYQLIGSPVDPIRRYAVMFAWLGAPALYARVSA
jgi:hypothetical protein